MIERFLEPGVIIAFITLAGVLVGNLLQRRSSKEKNAAELKAVEANSQLEGKKLALEQTKADQAALKIAQEALQASVQALQETVSAQQERIRFIAAQQAATNDSLLETQRQLEVVKMALHEEQSYTQILVDHIEARLPPPPPPRPTPHHPPLEKIKEGDMDVAD